MKHAIKGRHCWLRLRRHKLGEPWENGMHRFRTCLRCPRRVMTHHINCHKSCWGGPG